MIRPVSSTRVSTETYAARSTSTKEKTLTSLPSRRSFAKRSPSTVLASRRLRRKRSPNPWQPWASEEPWRLTVLQGSVCFGSPCGRSMAQWQRAESLERAGHPADGRRGDRRRRRDVGRVLAAPARGADVFADAAVAAGHRTRARRPCPLHCGRE